VVVVLHEVGVLTAYSEEFMYCLNMIYVCVESCMLLHA
jgi:hypothetical protein